MSAVCGGGRAWGIGRWKLGIGASLLIVRYSIFPLALIALSFTPLQAQLERIDVPSGVLRVGAFFSLGNTNSRFNDGTTESILGPAIPPVTTAESEVNIGVMGLDVGLGIVNRVTIFGRVPLVRYRSRATIVSDSAPEIRQDTSLTLMGDIEVGGSFTLMDKWDRNGALGGIRTAVGALVRLPTGEPRNIYDPLDLGTGTGQTDLALGAVVDWGAGNWGVRLTGGYTIQFAATVQQAVRSPETPIEPAPITNLQWTPGNVLHLGARPFFRLAKAFALQVGATYRVHSEDHYEYATAADAIPGLDPAIMSQGTSTSSLMFGGGISYSSPSAADPHGKGLPVEAHWTYEAVVASSKGIVPKSTMMRVGLRLYFGLWGNSRGR